MSALDELATRYGIEAVSEDAFGKEHVTSQETKRALLRAMHVDAESEEAAAASLRRMLKEDLQRVLPRVHVAYVGRAMLVPLTLPHTTRLVTWELLQEDGRSCQESVNFPDLQREDLVTDKNDLLETRYLPISGELSDGYHTLQIHGVEDTCAFIVTPGTCWLPKLSDSRKVWGFAAQLYLLKSESNWGIGDFADLQTLIAISRQAGAGVVGLNPLHAMFLDQPEQASPYSPSDRLLLNTLYISLELVPELSGCAQAQAMIASEDFQRKLQECREAPLVKYADVAELKMSVLSLLFEDFQRQENVNRSSEFEAFHGERRELLDRACLFQALRDHFTRSRDGLADCKDWPAPYRSYRSPEVQRFRQEHANLIRFHLWLQWIADSQLRAAAEACDGMPVGIYRDLAVGSAPSGAEVWSHPTAMVAGVSVGAPPDIWNPAGQNWALPPLHPHAGLQDGYASFIDLIRTNMRYAGALRIDHALALQRLYWIPQDASPKDGAYVKYPMEDLIGILALESQRNRCMIIGEDLGTVPAGFRERMTAANILSYRVLLFERDESGFLSPDTYPELSLSVASSHDLPTLRGWWVGTDLDAKDSLGLFPSEESARDARAQRAKDREALTKTLHEHLLAPATGEGLMETTFIDAAHRLLARTSSMLTLVQLDDLTHELEQVNIPGTSGDEQNWRRRLSRTLEEMGSDVGFSEVAERMNEGAGKNHRGTIGARWPSTAHNMKPIQTSRLP